MPFDRSEAWRALGLTILGLAVILAVMIGLRKAATSRPSELYSTSSPAVQAWFKNQHNEQGQWCCDESDGHPYYGHYAINPDGSVTLLINGKRRDLPAYMVLKGKNPTGAPVYWYTEDQSGNRRDYCFAPGAMG